MITIDLRLYAPATQRNREPILEVMKEHLPDSAEVLEIASGTGEHAVFFSDQIAKVQRWQPTDIESSSLKSIDAWREHQSDNKVLRAKYLDLTSKDMHLDCTFNTIVAINLTHITPWKVTEALINFAADRLPPQGILYLYGPFWQADIPPVESNLHFDNTLKRQNSEWGIRELDLILEKAYMHGLSKKAVIPMPSNNLSVVFTKLLTH